MVSISIIASLCVTGVAPRQAPRTGRAACAHSAFVFSSLLSCFCSLLQQFTYHSSYDHAVPIESVTGSTTIPNPSTWYDMVHAKR
jgi:hypothetical protein